MPTQATKNIIPFALIILMLHLFFLAISALQKKEK